MSNCNECKFHICTGRACKNCQLSMMYDRGSNELAQKQCLCLKYLETEGRNDCYLGENCPHFAVKEVLYA